jgi:FtsP/CotA-like multicopper oxidase with cupredoxin domain
VVIQDRMFTVTGELFFDNAGINPEHPFWVPEFVGDVICVNGKSWPFLNVGQNSYRFLFVNGSNARAYELDLKVMNSGQVGPPMWVIGTDGGYLDKPVRLDPALPQGQGKLVIMPGERYDVVINFAGQAGQSLLLRNTARTPYPGGAPAQGSTTGGSCGSTSWRRPAPTPPALVTPRPRPIRCVRRTP